MTFWQEVQHFFILLLYGISLFLACIVTIYILTDATIRVVTSTLQTYFQARTKFLLDVTVEVEEEQEDDEVVPVASTLKN